MTGRTGPIWQDHFQPGERLLWEGAPVPGRLLTGRDVLKIVLAVPFALLGWAMFALGVGSLFVADSLMGAAAVLFLAVMGLFIAAVGGAMLVEPFRSPAASDRHMRYALSDRCAHIQRPAPRPGVERYPIAPLAATGIYRDRGRDTVWFDARSWEHETRPRGDGPDEDRIVLRVEIASIAEGETVLRMIRGLQAGVTS